MYSLAVRNGRGYRPVSEGVRRVGEVFRRVSSLVGVNLKEAPMLEETLVKWRDEIRKEAMGIG